MEAQRTWPSSRAHTCSAWAPIHIADMARLSGLDESAITTGQVLSVDSGATVV